MKMFHCRLWFLAILLSAGSALADQVFPPVNEAECTPDTALTWTGSGTNVRCEKVLRTIDKLGDPLLAKIVATSSFKDFNQSIEEWIYASESSAETIASWLQNCRVVDGQLPRTASESPLTWEYCMRAFCKAKVGKQPFMARMAEQCSEGGHADCAAGHFYISAQCLTTMK